MREDFSDKHMAWRNGGRRRVYSGWKMSTNTVDGYETDTKCAHSVHGRPTLKDEERFQKTLREISL